MLDRLADIGNFAFVNTDELVSTAEASKLLKRSVGHVNHLVRTGRLAPVMQYPGSTGARLYHRSDVEALRDELAAS